MKLNSKIMFKPINWMRSCLSSFRFRICDCFYGGSFDGESPFMSGEEYSVNSLAHSPLSSLSTIRR